MMEDLPAPVLPTIPTFSQDFVLKLTSCRTKGRDLSYLKETPLNSTTPVRGATFCDILRQVKIFSFPLV